MDASLLAFLGLAIAGSLHCAGMCGGFAAAVALRRGAVGRRLALDQLAFVAGKPVVHVLGTHVEMTDTPGEKQATMSCRSSGIWPAITSRSNERSCAMGA